MSRPLFFTFLSIALILVSGSVIYTPSSGSGGESMPEPVAASGYQAAVLHKAAAETVSVTTAETVVYSMPEVGPQPADSGSERTPLSPRDAVQRVTEIDDVESADDGDIGAHRSAARNMAATAARAPSPEASQTDPASDDGGLAFLRSVYSQALEADPVLAAEVEQQIRDIEAELGVSENDAPTSTAAEQEAESDRTLLASDVTQGDDTVEEGNTPPKDEDFDWCSNRAPVAPGQFRCPCPSDPDYTPRWRDSYNPDIPAGAGC